MTTVYVLLCCSQLPTFRLALSFFRELEYYPHNMKLNACCLVSDMYVTGWGVLVLPGPRQFRYVTLWCCASPTKALQDLDFEYGTTGMICRVFFHHWVMRSITKGKTRSRMQIIGVVDAKRLATSPLGVIADAVVLPGQPGFV